MPNYLNFQAFERAVTAEIDKATSEVFLSIKEFTNINIACTLSALPQKGVSVVLYVLDFRYGKYCDTMGYLINQLSLAGAKITILKKMKEEFILIDDTVVLKDTTKSLFLSDTTKEFFHFSTRTVGGFTDRFSLRRQWDVYTIRTATEYNDLYHSPIKSGTFQEDRTYVLIKLYSNRTFLCPSGDYEASRTEIRGRGYITTDWEIVTGASHPLLVKKSERFEEPAMDFACSVPPAASTIAMEPIKAEQPKIESKLADISAQPATARKSLINSDNEGLMTFIFSLGLIFFIFLMAGAFGGAIRGSVGRGVAQGLEWAFSIVTFAVFLFIIYIVLNASRKE